ncbi:hypothetical protein J2X46_004452 [Nocardioides sp. BE266]|uniref:hypothetical protein n=1 Tax=Nocardioides sp. BE266 TaxID=2817725 RepID=UPI002860011B|nr:hypothetical protein [Nocardioides sp. BE266]MDR7255445.1 hypothetical protein [Nocardioides sp. BE266]
MKRWWLLGFLATIFTVLGVVLVVALGREDPVGYVAGGIFLVVGLGMWVPALAMRREEHLDDVAAPDAAPGGVPWSEVAERIRARFAGTPFTVETEGSVIRVRADLADATFLTWAAAHHVREVRMVEVVAKKPGEAITRDVSQGFDLRGGAGVLTGSARVQSGRSWSYTRRVELGVGTDGSVGKQVDIDFSSSQIQGPVDEVLRETGWKASWWGALPAEAKGALVMGAVGGLGAIAAVVAVIIDAVT